MVVVSDKSLKEHRRIYNLDLLDKFAEKIKDVQMNPTFFFAYFCIKSFKNDPIGVILCGEMIAALPNSKNFRLTLVQGKFRFNTNTITWKISFNFLSY
jgi:hypothetical protein